MTNDTTALAEQNAQNIKAIADALGMKQSELHSGASRKEKVRSAQRKAVFGIAKEENFEDDRSDKAVRQDLQRQNAQNILRIAEKVGVRKRDLDGEATSTELERQKTSALELEATGSEEGGSKDDRSKADVFGLGDEQAGSAE